MIKDAFRIMDFVNHLESIELDENDSPERRQAAAKEKAYQLESLDELKSLMKNSRSNSTRLIYYKYIEGYTIEEAALELGISYSHASNMHAAFSSYIKNPEKQAKPDKKPITKEYLETLNELINPEYKTCCIHCGGTTTIPHEVARKIFANESKRERAKARS